MKNHKPKSEREETLMEDVSRFLQIESVKWREHLFFNLLNFNCFKNSDWRSPLLTESLRKLSPLTVIPYVVFMEIVLFRGKRYFIMLKQHIAGMLVINEKPETLYINNLAVVAEYRKHGIATYMLNQANEIAELLNKNWLELSVSKLNIPALRLYRKSGFTKKKDKRWSFILRKQIQT